MSAMWTREPTTWELIVSLGLGTWMMAAVALAVGVLVARVILVPPRPVDDDGGVYEPRARELARYRTLIGFGFVGLLALPHRSLGDSLDDAWGNFNTSVPVALAAFLVLSLVFWLALRNGSREELAGAWPEIWSRIGRCVLATLAFWSFLYVCEGGSNAGSTVFTWLYLMAIAAFAGFFAMGCWCISCHWFGIGRAHPLLPPLVAGITILIMTGMELRSEGPEELPLRVWLLVNFAAVITTLGVCFVELCDAVYGSESRGLEPERWPVAVALTAVGLALLGTSVFVFTGSAEPVLCAGEAPLVNCADA